MAPLFRFLLKHVSSIRAISDCLLAITITIEEEREKQTKKEK